MASIFKRIRQHLHSERVALGIFAGLSVGTACFIALPQTAVGGGGKPVFSVPPIHTGTASSNPLKFTGALSQTKVIQGENATIYLDLTIDPPATIAGEVAKRASDVVVVLDRSGSMAAENRLPYAKAAIQDLLSRLGGDDRFALVTFDTYASVNAGLSPVTASERERLNGIVQAMVPGASTNISDGLEKARQLLENSPSDRSRRVILLSDGEANMGVVDPQALGKLASNFTTKSAVLSTIGMGLGFNETLMASLADYGMGNYSYLQNLASLGDIFQKDLADSRRVFASASTLELKLAAGVSVRDAAGYPSETGSGVTKIATGQLLGGARKHLVLTLGVPTANLSEYAIGDVELSYALADGSSSRATLDKSQLMLAVIEPARKAEAIASVNEAVFDETWNVNNLGLVQKKVSEALKRGDKNDAERVLLGYERDLRAQEQAQGRAFAAPATVQALEGMHDVLSDSFTGSAEEQKAKQNSNAKDIHINSLKFQRGQWSYSNATK